MKSKLIASIPALVLIFALTCGFGTFHVMLQNAEASDCSTLQKRCSDAEENESIACASGNAERCESAKDSAEEACKEYRDTCL
ncbi:MAG: hypothetical protein OXI61_10315 [Candidatus Poribacteria bacterium]|nr:hypothetical protein [Candidatus Poribacteria bacterium]